MKFTLFLLREIDHLFKTLLWLILYTKNTGMDFYVIWTSSDQIIWTSIGIFDELCWTFVHFFTIIWTNEAAEEIKTDKKNFYNSHGLKIFLSGMKESLDWTVRAMKQQQSNIWLQKLIRGTYRKRILKSRNQGIHNYSINGHHWNEMFSGIVSITNIQYQ